MLGDNDIRNNSAYSRIGVSCRSTICSSDVNNSNNNKLDNLPGY